MKLVRKLFREWGFPVGMVLAWMVVTAYTISLMSSQPRPARAVASQPRT